MKALTLWPEWAFAVRLLGKRIENRPRPASWYGLRIGETFAIHAGKHIGGRPGRVARAEGIDAVVRMYCHANGGLMNAGDLYELARCATSAIVAVATLDACVEQYANVGWGVRHQFGFVLRDVRVVEPIPCGGRQGLWTVPAWIADRIVTP